MTETCLTQKSLPKVTVSSTRVAQRPALLAVFLGLSHKQRPRFRDQSWGAEEDEATLADPASSGHSMFAQLQGAGKGGAFCWPGGFKGDRPVVTDGHWGPLLHDCWFKNDKDLTHSPQQKPGGNKGSPSWRRAGPLAGIPGWGLSCL